MPLHIQTSRLTLLPFTKIICEETLNNSTVMLTSLGIIPCNGWPDLETLETLPRIMINLDKVKKPSGFESWMMIERSTNLIIGDLVSKVSQMKQAKSILATVSLQMNVIKGLLGRRRLEL